MTRRSKRELERRVSQLDSGSPEDGLSVTIRHHRIDENGDIAERNIRTIESGEA